MERGQLPTKQDLKSVKGKEQDDVVMALTQAIGPDEAIKLLEQCDMSKHAAKLVPNKKGNPDGPLPKWGEPEGVEDAMKKTPGQKKVTEGKDSEHSWKAEGHYTKDGKEWKGFQHVYKGQIMTGKTHTDESEPLYHFKQLEKGVQQKVHAKIQAEACWKGWKKQGMKKKGDRMVPNCVKEEIKTIKVGEDAVGAKDPHYVIVKDRKVIAQGKKEEMMSKCGKDERVWLSTKKVGDVVEERSAQDPDIKDRKGTQPAAYHKGLKKTTKARRDAHFKKHGKKADDDASAYKDAPGDKKARKEDMPKSKYTKFVDKMMGEEHEIHVRLDHLDGDSRQKKAGDVLRKHEKAGHIKFHGETDKGVVFKAKSKSHADRLHKDLKPHATGVEHMNEGMSPESRKAHGRMFKAAQKKKDDSAAQAEREKRLKAKGWVKNDRGGMSKVSEAKFAVDIEGMPRFYMDSDSPAKVKIALRQMLKKASAVKSVTRTYDTNIKADLRARLKDASTDMQTNYVSEKLKASDDMGKWVDDFKDSDAPQFKGKSMKKRRQMAIAAKLAAMRESTEAYGKSVNKMADDKKKAGISASDKNKLGKLADMMKKERESKVTEAMGDAAHKAAVKHITDLGKKNNKTFGQQRMHIDNHPGKHDEKTRQAAKTINKNQFGNWKKGKDGKMTQEEAQQFKSKIDQHPEVKKRSDAYKATKPNTDERKRAVRAWSNKRKELMNNEETGAWKKDSGWRKAPAERKDEYGNTIKKQNIAKHLARKAMKQTEKKS